METTKEKIPVVVNMGCKGEIQCPLCLEYFSLTEGQVYSAGIMDCPRCYKKIEICAATAEMGNSIIKGEIAEPKAMQLCSLCGERPAAYKRVRHCRQCHSEYGKKNYQKHKFKKELKGV